MLLIGRTAIVTGASRGIGRAIALSLAEEGAHVAVCYLTNTKEAAEVVQRINSLKCGDAIAVNLDVRSRDSIKKALSTILDRFDSKIDILVNNAGINKPNNFDTISDEDWDEIMSVNLKGVFMMSQETLQYMHEGGRIINIASVSGQIGGPRTTHYAAAKAGVIALTENCALFVATKGILVNAISPGYIESPMANQAIKLPIIDRIPLKRLGTYEEVAKVAVFLASDGASYITAQTINVNGGLYF